MSPYLTVSEEMKNAARDVPRAMISSILINGLLGFIWLIVLLYVSPPLPTLLTFRVPFIGIVSTAYSNLGGTIFVELIIIYTAAAATIGLTSSTSRTVWAFARDKGLPLNPFLSRVNQKWEVPVNAIAVTTFLEMLLVVIYFGNTTAFNAILSLATVAMYLTYFIPIALMLFYARRKRELVFGPWKLGRMGWVLNLIAVMFTGFFFVLLNFPPVRESPFRKWLMAVLSGYGGEYELFEFDVGGGDDFCGGVLFRVWEEILSGPCY